MFGVALRTGVWLGEGGCVAANGAGASGCRAAAGRRITSPGVPRAGGGLMVTVVPCGVVMRRAIVGAVGPGVAVTPGAVPFLRVGGAVWLTRGVPRSVVLFLAVTGAAPVAPRPRPSRSLAS